ncbi:hypothetical protein CEXT_369501 [Caerostris extrusa]|uniref:Secreted protein n=1 Tax=Caerostris extrusa TaxID=172846 RepID=A0AAV4SQU3_CAEEX|nr:hypothetical protein CEXT_369501 [Caerostris extrusa]
MAAIYDNLLWDLLLVLRVCESHYIVTRNSTRNSALFHRTTSVHFTEKGADEKKLPATMGAAMHRLIDLRKNGRRHFNMLNL